MTLTITPAPTYGYTCVDCKKHFVMCYQLKNVYGYAKCGCK